MKQNLYILLFLIICGKLSAQDTVQCINIDFETLPGGIIPFEGLPISEQYRDDFGLFFELENGEVPVIAEVGNPATAFGSAWGDDSPAPGVDLGEYFLTDDGVLFTSTTFAIPIIVRFDVPVDTFSGCIMDMDFGEEFIIHARDLDDNIILADTIRAGDPGTGDGQQTCWGFNLPDCLGTIYSIRYEGFRETGFFGMGLDNLTFCTGIDVNTQITSVSTEPSCDSLVSGTLEIINDGPGVFEYAIDGGEFQDEPIFTDISAGEHIVTFLESRGCIESLPFVVEGPLLIEFIDVGAQHTTCAEDNGAFQLLTNISDSVQFSINGNNFQETNFFSNLAPDTYTITAQDKYGCLFEADAIINPSTLPEIDSYVVEEDDCSQMIGSILLNASGGTGEYLYSINGSAPQNVPVFSNLSEAQYTIIVIDEDNCTDEEIIDVPGTPDITNIRFAVDHPFCKEDNGAIKVSASGGTGAFTFTLNDITSQTDPVFGNLPPGVYTIDIEDELGCVIRELVELDIPKCPVWIPNVISPNGDATNELFTVHTVDDYNLGILEYYIFDRWGELVFQSGNFSIYSNAFWWDGTFRGKDAETGVYAFLVEVEHPNGEFEFFAGDVTLLR